jgi:hypothetical protein
MILEAQYWKAIFANQIKSKVKITEYTPHRLLTPSKLPQVESAWKGIESILADLIERFHLGTDQCLEFGVEYGYSTAALSCFFNTVTGVDTFTGDQHTVSKQDIYTQTNQRLSAFQNIKLIRSAFQDWIKQDTNSYDLIHVDIVHTYAATFDCGLWSAEHARCIIFHDTESFPAVKQAVRDIARQTGKSFYNYRPSNGLGILIG